MDMVNGKSRHSCLFRTNTPTLFRTTMSNELGFGAPATRQSLFLTSKSGSFHAAHDFTINSSTFNDVRGNYVRDHFVVVCTKSSLI